MFDRYSEHFDENLATWAQIKGWGKWNLLLGNGFSLNISRAFDYTTLLNVASRTTGTIPLHADSLRLFDALKTTNFEEVLRYFQDSKRVGEVLAETTFRDRVQGLERNVRDSLAAAIHSVHIEPAQLRAYDRDKKLHAEFRRYERIFTTNYDLIPYWAIMSKGNPIEFVDFFYSNGETFAPGDDHDLRSRTGIYYLHGALHLSATESGAIRKQHCTEVARILDQVLANIRESIIPHFISEGTWQQKLTRIRASEYLRFAYGELSRSTRQLAVLGHSLTPKYDKHLVDLMIQPHWKERKIAVAIHPKFVDNIRESKVALRDQLPEAKLIFFDSRTHPLGDESLAIIRQ